MHVADPVQCRYVESVDLDPLRHLMIDAEFETPAGLNVLTGSDAQSIRSPARPARHKPVATRRIALHFLQVVRAGGGISRGHGLDLVPPQKDRR
ncbi:hypothetical protein ACWDLG_42710 [Nonomuraea sp. NPDC003727]